MKKYLAILLSLVMACPTWAIERNVASQKLTVVAIDRATGGPKTGDAANITCYVSKDDGSVTVLGDTSATEADSTNAKGVYLFDLTQAETSAAKLAFSGKSSTSNIDIIPQTLYTTPAGWSTGVVSTGDAYARLGAPAGASVSADIAAAKADTAAIKTKTDQLTFTAANKLDSNALAINGVSTSSVTTVNANVGTTQPTNFTGTSTSALVKTVESAKPQTWYVTTAGNDANSGLLRSSAFLTITAAITAANPGDTIRVLAGTYTEPLTISKHDLTIEGDGRSATIITRSTTGYTILVTGNHFHLKRCRVSTTSTEPNDTEQHAIHDQFTYGNTYEDLDVRGFSDGFFFNSVAGMRISRCKIDSKFDALVLNGGDVLLDEL